MRTTGEGRAASQVNFDRMAPDYDARRRANPDLAALVRRHLRLRPGMCVLDLGCGTGNYTPAAAAEAGRVVGADLSRGMLERARGKWSAPDWVQADARRLPFRGGVFDGALAILVLHHIPEWRRAVAEAGRVLGRGRFVALLATAEQIRAFWLFHYFPGGLELFLQHRPELADVRNAFRDAGFAALEAHPFHYTEFSDAALMVGKRKPSLYLDPDVRAGITMFRRLPVAEVEEGLRRLREDVESGRIEGVLGRYPHGADDPGDAYLFVASKA